MMIGTDPISRVRFAPDPRRPYLARGRARLPDEPAVLKRYQMSAWSGTQTWRARVAARCLLIERVTCGLTRFRTDGDLLFRISRPAPGLTDTGRDRAVSPGAVAALLRTLSAAHAAGLAHGDVTRRNVIAGEAGADLFDWEPILVAPGPAPAEDPAPDRVTDPTRWLGGCDLIGLLCPGARTRDLDLSGLQLMAEGRA
jgi:hypothetical protein